MWQFQHSDYGCLCLLVARNSDSKSTWSPGSVTNTSLAHELWKVPLPPKSITAPSRPPPGLTGQKPPLSTWDNSLRLGGGWGNSDARYTPGKDVSCVGRLCVLLSSWGVSCAFARSSVTVGQHLCHLSCQKKKLISIS